MAAIVAFLALQACAELQITKFEASAEKGTVQFRGLGAGAFRAQLWREEKLHFLPDIRRPLIAPKEGAWRNIYAASIVKTSKGWRIFYGGWDGTETGNDCIYSTDTSDWITFQDRRKVIDHGAFQHVCNVSAISQGEGFALMCTAFPDGRGLNKPVFVAPGSAKPQAAQIPGFEDADINGMNALVRLDGKYCLYFGDFRKFGTIYRASSDDGKTFKLDGPVLRERLAVNDVKKIGKSYLMGLHMNGQKLYYSVSDDPMKFPKAQALCSSIDDTEKFIVSIGWVSDGEQLLGVLYGAGAKGSLDANRIFARWLQKRIVLFVDGKRVEASGSFGPDRQVFEFTTEKKCSIEIYDEDGSTLLKTIEMTLTPSGVYEIHGSESQR